MVSGIFAASGQSCQAGSRLLVQRSIHDQLVAKLVAFMRDVIPTSENIVVRIWRELEPAITPGKLVRLVLWETPNNYVEYTGE